MPTYAVTLAAPTSGLPSNVEAVRGEVRLATRYPWLTGDYAFTTAVSGSDPSGWTLDQSGEITARDVSITRQGRVHWMLGGGNQDYTTTAPYLGRDISGDFDCWCEVWLPYVTGGLFIPQLSAYSSRASTSNLVSVRFRHSPGFDANILKAQFFYAGTSTDVTLLNDYTERVGETVRVPYRMRLARSGNSWTAYRSTGETISWTQIGTAQTVALASTVRLAVGMDSYLGSSSPFLVQWSPVYTWPTFITTSPQIIREYDAGDTSAVWKLDTFWPSSSDELIRSFASAGASLTYAWYVGNVSESSFTASNQTLGQLQSAGDRTGRYLRLGVTLPSDGAQDTRWAGATMQVVAPIQQGMLWQRGMMGGYAA